MTVILSYTIAKKSRGREYECFRDFYIFPEFIRLFMNPSTNILQDDWSVTTAERLRELRLSRGLSWQKLSAEIKKASGTSISADSLSNYEVTYTQNHSRSHKTRGMKIEFLKVLAEFYGVSSDYLLGISNIPSNNPDMQSAIQFTGLSQTAIEGIQRLHSREGTVHQADILNWLISNPRFTIALIHKLDEYLSMNQTYITTKNTRNKELQHLAELTDLDIAKEIQLRSSGEVKITISEIDVFDSEDRKDLALFRVTRHFDSILTELSESFCTHDAVYSSNEEEIL